MPAGDRIPRILVESPESFCQHDRSCNTLPVPFPRAGGFWVGQRNGGGKGWPFEPRTDLFRSFVLVISLFVLALLLMVNPAQFFSDVPIAPALLKLIPILLDTAKAVLFQAKVYHFSVLTLLLPPIVLSYVFLVAAASTIQRLAGVRK